MATTATSRTHKDMARTNAVACHCGWEYVAEQQDEGPVQALHRHWKRNHPRALIVREKDCAS